MTISCKKRVNLALHGRLGNQLFQVSYAKYIENLGFEARFDISNFDEGLVLREAFPYLFEYVNSRRMKYTKFMPKIDGRLRTIQRIIGKAQGYKHFLVDRSAVSTNVFKPLPSSWVFGYFQRIESAEIARKEILMQTSISHLKKGVIGIHVRAGDYKTIESKLEEDYYLRGLEMINEWENKEIEIYSDELSVSEGLAKRIGKKSRAILTPSPSVDFMNLMACEHLVISRSTFSWWAAYLSYATRIVFPDPWHLNHPEWNQFSIPQNGPWVALKS